VRTTKILLIIAIITSLSGCSRHLYWLEITPEKQVMDGFDEDKELRNTLYKLAKGPNVEGNKCVWFPMSSSAVEQTRQMAYADAMTKAGSPYNALIDVMQTSTSYAPFAYCVSLRGTPVKQETYYATSSLATTGKRKVGAR
jgi:hypothetical protein